MKICGITRVEDAVAAIRCGADALGFVFWPRSPRFVSPDEARDIIASVPQTVAKVGVFVNQSADEVNAAADRAGVTMVQLHGDESPAYAAGISRPVIKSISGRPGALVPAGWAADVIWLVDAHDPERRGGTGRQADWSAAAALAASHKVLLAGGLTPANVGDAIASVRPFGIDVSSGVESAPGIKDRELLLALFGAIHGVTGHQARS